MITRRIEGKLAKPKEDKIPSMTGSITGCPYDVSSKIEAKNIEETLWMPFLSLGCSLKNCYFHFPTICFQFPYQFSNETPYKYSNQSKN